MFVLIQRYILCYCSQVLSKVIIWKLKNGEKETPKPCVYVLDFKGDISASETTALREEISAIINVAKADDEVLLRLESPGGVVHGYGLAASQLARLKQKGIKIKSKQEEEQC